MSLQATAYLSWETRSRKQRISASQQQRQHKTRRKVHRLHSLVAAVTALLSVLVFYHTPVNDHHSRRVELSLSNEHPDELECPSESELSFPVTGSGSEFPTEPLLECWKVDSATRTLGFVNSMGFITALVPPDGCNVTAAGEQLQTFGSPHAAVIEEYGVSTTGEPDDRRLTGCSAVRLSCSIHCNGFPHVETVAHCLSGTPFEPFLRGVAGRPRKIGVFDCLPHGTLETAVLVRPSVTRLGDSVDTYPAGSREDAVVTKQSLENAVRRLRLPSDVGDSPVSLVVSVEDVSAPIVGSWENWPYLTTEAVQAMINGDLVDADGSREDGLGRRNVESLLDIWYSQ
ncbi:hypothetical protein FOZ60_015731 [Perkinsus olseni]|uniref:Uncharacterized protein n=1 Tax=Perkinsus olseni TaxID=32597 RepID=A0A7J6PL00_PEROL|nr:hypothetical protein FOZ60_015731 [Perkinsus olseni]